jgi:hypothetical protein
VGGVVDQDDGTDSLRGKQNDSAVQLMTKLWLILGPILPESQLVILPHKIAQRSVLSSMLLFIR